EFGITGAPREGVEPRLFVGHNREMKRHIVALVVIPMATVFVLRSTVHAQPTKSVWDAIYTEEQAKRGSPLYTQYCASCHGPELMGGEMAPPLASGDFLSGWDGLT